MTWSTFGSLHAPRSIMHEWVATCACGEKWTAATKDEAWQLLQAHLEIVAEPDNGC
jgi:hypothetical protein